MSTNIIAVVTAMKEVNKKIKSILITRSRSNSGVILKLNARAYTPATKRGSQVKVSMPN